MSLWTSLEPASATVDPGSTTQVRLRVRNTGDVVDEYRFEPVGGPAPWTRVEPQTLRLYPGTTGTVELTFTPPRTPDATAGPNPYAVRITPTEHPQAVTVPEGNLTITPFSEVRAELVPVTVKGRFRGRPRLAVDNLGNTKVTASVSGSDSGEHLSYEIRPAALQIEPGRAAFVDAALRPRRIIWFGSREERPFTLAVRRSGAEPTQVQGTYVQRGFLPRWLATSLGLVTALAITFVMLWIAYKPQVRSSATEQTQQAGNTLPPSAAPKPLASPSAAEPPAKEQPPAGGIPRAAAVTRNRPRSRPAHPRGACREHPAAQHHHQDVRRTPRARQGAAQRPCPAGDLPRDGRQPELEPGSDGAQGGPGGAPLFLIRNVKDQLCMDLPYNGAQPIRTGITEFTCDGTTGDNQLWWIQKQDSGAYWIRNFASNNKCLDVGGYSDGGVGTRLTLFDCSNTDDQEWQIIHPAKD